MPVMTADFPAPSGPNKTTHKPRWLFCRFAKRTCGCETWCGILSLGILSEIEAGSIVSIDHHAYGHLENCGHALVRPFLGPAHGHIHDVAVLQLHVRRLVSENLVQCQLRLRAPAGRASDQASIRLGRAIYP